MAQAISEQIILHESTPDNVPHQVPPKPFPLFGEMAQGFMVATFVAEQRKDPLNYPFSEMYLARDLYAHSSLGCVDFYSICCSRKTHRLHLSESLSGGDLKILVHVGLKERFRELYSDWARRSQDINATYRQKLAAQQNEAKARVTHETASLRYSIHETVVQEVLLLYP